jgi:hypothetical protein
MSVGEETALETRAMSVGEESALETRTYFVKGQFQKWRRRQRQRSDGVWFTIRYGGVEQST